MEDTIILPRETVQQALDALLCLSQGDSLGARKEITALRAKLQKAEPLCEDEGCPHHGSPHICISKPQAQAGEPPIAGWRVLIAGLYEFFRHQEDAQAEREQHDKYELANGGEVGEAPEPLITLQAHREAFENVRRANIEAKIIWDMLKADYDAQREAITKKDAALKTCVEALNEASVALRIGHNSLVALEKCIAAIPQAQEAMKS